VLDVSSGREVHAYRGADQLGVPAGAPDGRHIAVIEAVCSDRGIICGSVRLMREDGADARLLDLDRVEVSDLSWRDARRLLYAGLREAQTVVGEYDLGTGKHRELWSSDELTISGWYPHVAPFGTDGALAVLESYDRAPAIARLHGGSAELIRSFAPDGIATIPGGMQPVRWQGRDGLEITGWLILPNKGGGSLPLLVDVHGGPIAAHRNRYAAALRAAPVLAAHGWAIFLPNPRGSGGRGQDFARRVVGDMGGEDAHDILCGIDKLVADGIADTARVAIFGTSYGGFMSAMMLAFHRRFAAAVPMSPVVNWYSQHFASQIPWFDQAFLGGSPRAPGGPYFERSAVFHLEGVTTPTLVIGGARDKNTPVNQAVELYNALSEAGAPAALAIYPEDGHSMRGYPAYIDSAARILDWLQRHVQGEDSS
jgi:dipeptidyl aminopeptidase/acylaminoacyl peptidase